MATRTFGRDFNALNHGVGGHLAAIGSSVEAGLQAMGPLGRRFALTAFGAVLALALGAATASAFRLPSAVTDPAQPQDQMVVQSELPSEAVARAYALDNPPVYTIASDHADAATSTDMTVETTSSSGDAAPTPAVSYTVPVDASSPTDKADAASSAPTPATPAQSNDAGQSQG